MDCVYNWVLLCIWIYILLFDVLRIFFYVHWDPYYCLKIYVVILVLLTYFLKYSTWNNFNFETEKISVFFTIFCPFIHVLYIDYSLALSLKNVEFYTYVCYVKNFSGFNGFFHNSTVCLYTFLRAVINSNSLMFTFVVTLCWCVDISPLLRFFNFYRLRPVLHLVVLETKWQTLFRSTFLTKPSVKPSKNVSICTRTIILVFTVRSINGLTKLLNGSVFWTYSIAKVSVKDFGGSLDLYKVAHLPICMSPCRYVVVR